MEVRFCGRRMSLSQPVIPSEGEPVDVFDHKVNPNRSRGTLLALGPRTECAGR